MYTAIYILLLLGGAYLIYLGSKKDNRRIQIAGGFLVLVTILFFWFLGFWAEQLWFDATSYGDRFWTVWATRFLAFLIAFISGGGIGFRIDI